MFRLLVALLTLVGVVSATKNFTRRVGQERSCVNGKWHNIKYDTYGLDEAVFVDLDSTNHLKLVTCDIDHTKIKLKFSSVAYAGEWLLKFHDWNDHYLIGGLQWGCPMVEEGTGGRAGLIIRRVIGADIDVSGSLDTVFVTASEAMYDEIYQDADISFNTEGSCTEADTIEAKAAVGKGADKDECIGWNSDCTGSGAKAVLPLFSNKFTTLACDDCFVDMHVDVFIDVSIRGFQVQNLSAGFRNMYANGSLVLGAVAQEKWNTGVDKTIDLIPSTNLVNFKVGPVPFLIYFDMPVQITADATFETDANLKVGAEIDVQFGDAYVYWTPSSHWQHTKPQPKMKFTPTFSSAAAVTASASASIVPTLTAHFDKILSYQMVATPKFNFNLDGSEASKQVCAKSTAELTIDSTTNLNINIPWANIADDKSWKSTVYDSGSLNLVDKCIPL